MYRVVLLLLDHVLNKTRVSLPVQRHSKIILTLTFRELFESFQSSRSTLES